MPNRDVAYRRTLSVGVALAVCAAPSLAFAYPNGIAASGCGGCHRGGTAQGSLSFSTSPSTFDLGERVEVTVTLTASNIAAGGMFITANDVGTIAPIANEGLKPQSNGLVHERPKTATNGTVRFRFAWTAPNEPGAVQFSVFALGTDGNGRSSGDTAFEGQSSHVFGCEGQTYYYDGDGDGFGRDGLSTLACAGAPPQNFVPEGTDCVDYDESVYPGAPEICDQKDNDCDSEIDENAEPVMLWPDADGDGYYERAEGEPMVGCVGIRGYAAEGGDCAPDNPDIHPGAEETCNFIDDDCDGAVDERVRPICGEGWCRREALGCSLELCTPGQPSPEICNYIDDDCDGLIDEGSLCGAGQVCVDGTCIADTGETPGDNGGGSTSGGGNAGGGENGGEAPSSTSSSSCVVGHGRGAVSAFALLALSVPLWRRRRARTKG